MLTSALAMSDAALAALLDEDAPYGDLTTGLLGIGAEPACLTFTARAKMTVCGSEEAARLFELAGASSQILAASGSRSDGPILAAEGDATSLHRAWKVAQVLVELYSGIASATASIVASLRTAG